jgi:hypothetical protein
MTRSITLSFVGLLLALQPALGNNLSAERMRALAAMKDDRSKVPDALKVYPSATEYSVLVRVTMSGERTKQAPRVIAREALVEGKYLVTTFRPPAYNADLITVVYFDEAQDCYRSATLLPDGSIGHAIGTRVSGDRVISWIAVASPEDKKQSAVLMQESHSDKERRWREITIEDGKVIGVVEGVATVTKKPQ